MIKHYRSWLTLQGEISGTRCTHSPEDLLRHIRNAENENTYVRCTLESGDDSVVAHIRPSAILCIQPLQQQE